MSKETTSNDELDSGVEAPDVASPPAAQTAPPESTLVLDKRTKQRLIGRRRTERGDDTNKGRLHHNCTKLSEAEKNRCLKLRRKGWEIRELAEEFKVSTATISRHLNRYPDTTELARAKAEHSAVKMQDLLERAAEVAAEKGDGDIMLEVLDRLDSLAARPKNAPQVSAAPQVVVVVGGRGTDPKLIEQALPKGLLDVPDVLDVTPEPHK